MPTEKQNFLVFERAEQGAPEQFVGFDANGGRITTKDTRVAILPYFCVGAVKATDESAAVQAVIRATRRVGAYAVLPAVFLDFTKEDEDSQVDADLPQLNP